AEERGQSEAIAQSIAMMAGLNVPIVSVVIGEGGSDGALAIGVCDRLVMLQFATYSVISPEGCASILWKSADKAQTAASAMKITSESLKQNELVDIVVKEPLGGAHRDPDQTAERLGVVIQEQLQVLDCLTTEELLRQRDTRLRSFGRFKDES
ncbi:MAG TPA: acetyl-CoA carboxylase carboxyl transferase subunit alpha, partial [Gammaproteobacteria bacterium]|nr:acetyl-CoA carboxylase carboxyl transferase subunit alpha [Gammaproteobacteria bacterium]